MQCAGMTPEGSRKNAAGGIWAELLKVARGRHDNFFELGGHASWWVTLTGGTGAGYTWRRGAIHDPHLRASARRVPRPRRLWVPPI